MSNISDILGKIGNVEVLEKSEVLTTRKKVKTPSEVFNILFGGGIPFGTIVGLYGPPGSGKSTLAYGTASEFQRTTENGIVVILDVENSADPNRLGILGIDTAAVVRMVPSSINNGFDQLFEFVAKLKKNTPKGQNYPLVIIWDTISKGMAEEGEEPSRMNAMNRARVIKSRMGELVDLVGEHDIVAFLLNQVVMETDRYGNKKMGAGGGVALRN